MGPCALQFQAAIATLSVGGIGEASDSVSTDPLTESEGCARLWVWDGGGRRVGAVWSVDVGVLDVRQARLEGGFVLLSRIREKDYETHFPWHFNVEVGTCHEWCMTNVMLVKRVGGRKSERIPIGKVHENCAVDAVEGVIDLV